MAFGTARGRSRGDRGAAIVEFALITPLFFALVLGMFTGGVLANKQMEVTHAAREGGRYGATIPVDETFSSGTWATHVRDVVVEQSDGQLSAGNVCVALVEGDTPVPVSGDHTTKTDGSACFDDSASEEIGLRVQVKAVTSGRLECVFFSRQIAVTATVTARHEGVS
jgi:Flp pilus assembly protein TadG